MRLAAARMLAWALWLTGWLVIGEFGHEHTALWAGGLAPVAGWLLAIGALLSWTQPLPARALAAALLLGAATAAAGLLNAQALPLLAGWALLVVAASRVVRGLRRGREAGSPLGPALGGALLAWALAGNLETLNPWAIALALPVVAALLVVLLPRGAAPAPGCRGGLFDCALPVAALAPWRERQRWPQQAALLAMLPMMAALPAMADWCTASGASPRTTTAVHLGVMLLPPALLQWPLRRATPARLNTTIALLLVAGGLALLLQPGLPGLALAALLHGAAWGLAWGGPLAAGTRHANGPTPFRAALAVAALLLVLGLALHEGGPAALAVAHGLVALGGAAGLLGARHNRFDARPGHRHP
jgi:hypothetical protein